MKLSCALVLALANLVIGTPFSFSVKGGGSSSKVVPASATFGTFGLVQPVASEAEYSGSFSKPSSASFAANSASGNSGSFSYNAAQGTPSSVLYNTGANFGASGQVSDQNVGVTPQAFTAAVPSGSGVSGFISSESVSGIQANANTASDSSVGQQPSYFGSTSYVSGSQGNDKPNTFVSGSPAYTVVSDSSSSKDIYGVKHTSHVHNTDTISQFQHQFVATGSVNSVPATQGQTAPTAEIKPVYSSGFGGPPGVLSPYDKASVSGVHIQSSNSYPYQQNIQLGESWNSTPQDVYYTSQQQQSVTLKPSGGNYYTSIAESSNKPEKQPTYQTEKKPVSININERPTSESKPSKDVQTSFDKYSYQKPEVESPQKPEVSDKYTSETIKPGYQISVQAYPAKQTEKVEFTKKPSYTGGFGAPAGVLKPIESTFSEVPQFVSTTVKPEQYEESNPTVTYSPTVTKVNKYSSISEEVYPTEKPYENTNYQSPNVGSSPASYVTLKPTGSVSYFEQDSSRPSFSVSSTAGSVGAIEQKDDKQILSKPYNNIPVNPTYSTWEQNPTQASTSFAIKPETVEPAKPSVQISLQSKPTFSNAPATFTTSQPPSYSYPYEEKNPASSIPGGYGPSSVAVTVDETKPNYQLLSTTQYESSQNDALSNQAEEKKASYQPYPTGSSFISSGVVSSHKPEQTSVQFDETKPSGTVVTSQKEVATANAVEESSYSSKQVNEKEIPATTFTTSQPPSYSYPYEEKNPTSSIPGGYGPSSVSVSVVETKPNYQPLSTNQYESSQNGAVANQADEKKTSYQPYPTGSSFISSGVVSSHKPEQTFVQFSETKPSGTVFTGQKDVATASGVEGSSYLSKEVNEKEIPATTFGTVKPTVSQNFAVHNNAATGFVSASQQPTKIPSFEGSSDKLQSITYVEQKKQQKPITEVNNWETPSKVPVFTSNTFSDKVDSQYPKKPTETNQNKPLYSSSFGTLTGSTGYKPSSQGQESAFVTGYNEKVSEINFGTTVKPYVKPELSTGSQQTTVSTSSVSQNTDKQKYTGSFSVQNKVPSVVTSEGQKFTNQVFTTNSAVGSGATAFVSKPYYQLPTVQPSVQKNTWHTNTFGTAKPYNNYYPGFTSSFTTYGQDSSQDKTKQTSQITSTGQYSQSSSGLYKPYTTGQYKPYNTWGFNGHPSYQKYSNVYPTGGSIVSTYSPTTFKPFVTSSPFDKSKTSTSFSATANKESTYASRFGSLSVTTAKPLLTQTSNKPVPESTVSGGHFEKPKVVVSTAPTFGTPVSKPSETNPRNPPNFTQNSGSLVTSSFGQSSFSTLKPTVNYPTSSAQFEFDSETGRPFAQSPSEVASFDTNNKSGLSAEVTKVSESTSTPVSEVNSSVQNKPYPNVYVGSFSGKPFSPSTSQIKVDEKIQSSQTSKPYWSSNLNQKQSSVGVGVTPNGLKPTEQPFVSTTLYYNDKEVTPTQISAIKPSSYGTFTKETFSPSKGTEKNQYNQNPKPEWSAEYNKKEPSLSASVGGSSESLKPTGQSFFSTSPYFFNKEITPTQVSAVKPSSPSTVLTTGTTNVGSVESVQSNTNDDSSVVPLSTVQKWASTTTPENAYKPEYSSTFEQSSSHVFNSSPLEFSATISGSGDNSKPHSATGNSQYSSYEIHEQPSFPRPTAQVSVVDKKPTFIAYYKEKDTNQASFAKPTVPSEYSTDIKVGSKYTDSPTKVPTSLVQSTQIPYKPTEAQTSQQTLGFNSNTGASQSTSYVGGFGGPAGILKPNDYSSQSQQQYVQTQYKPSYNNQVPWVNQQNSPNGVNSNAASYFGGFGSPSGVLTASENIKPNGFGYVQSVKHTANVQTQKDVTQHAVFESQASAGGQLNAAVSSNTDGLVSNPHRHIQNPFNGAVSTGTGFVNTNQKITGQFSGTKPFSGSAQSSAGNTPNFHSYLSTTL